MYQIQDVLLIRANPKALAFSIGCSIRREHRIIVGYDLSRGVYMRTHKDAIILDESDIEGIETMIVMLRKSKEFSLGLIAGMLCRDQAYICLEIAHSYQVFLAKDQLAQTSLNLMQARTWLYSFRNKVLEGRIADHECGIAEHEHEIAELRLALENDVTSWPQDPGSTPPSPPPAR